MPKVVQTDRRQAGIPQSLAPPIANGVLVRGLPLATDEQPMLVPPHADQLDMLGEHLQKAVATNTFRSDPYFGGGIDTIPLPARCTCR